VRAEAPTLRSAAPVRAGLATSARDHLTLMKPKVTLLLTAFGVVAATVADARVAVADLALFALLGFMAAGGAAALNHVFDRDIDARMERTRARPLPSGRMRVGRAVAFATLLLSVSVGLAAATLGWAVAAWMVLGAAAYAGLYSLVLKRSTHHNIVIGGIAGSCGVLAGWSLVDPALGAGAWLLALLVFAWTPPHFWGLAIARDADYRAAAVPMLPQTRGIEATARAMTVYAALTWAASVLVVIATPLGAAYLTVAIVLGGLFVALNLRLCVAPGRRLAITVFKASGAYLGLLLVAMWLDPLL